MAKRGRHGPPAGRRPDTIPLGSPIGILHHVLLDHWMTYDPAFRSRLGPVDGALLGHGLFASDRVGSSVVKVRCGDRPCSWFFYQLQAGGAVLGVRACSEHRSSAMEEALWVRTEARAEDFYAWEVMSS